MKRIKITPDNINEYYQKVNELIDSYFESWNIKPSSLRRYLKKGSIGLKKFIERNELGNVERIEKIILDVVEDRYGMEKDNVIKFESFEVFDNTEEDDMLPTEYPFFDHLIFKDLEKSGQYSINYQKAICDKYRVSLGHVEVEDKESNIYHVNMSRNKTLGIFLLSEDDLQIMITNLNNIIVDIIHNKTISMMDVNFEEKISKFLKDKEEMLNLIEVGESDILEVVSDLLQNEGFDYDGSFKNYYFWVE